MRRSPSLDFPVDWRSRDQRRRGLIRGQAKFDRNFAAGKRHKVLTTKGDNIFIPLVADYDRRTVLTGACCTVLLLHAAEDHGEGTEVGNMSRCTETSAQSSAKNIRERIVA